MNTRACTHATAGHDCYRKHVPDIYRCTDVHLNRKGEFSHEQRREQINRTGIL
jgi:hypothetical protein